MVDIVTVFEEDTPLELIKVIMPDVFVKGGDYTIDQIAGAKEVIENGGRVIHK
jgi:D-beta-D-heptose 7-phosphate kinase/D-beta-D-heptose 1-phosphate adenosyltransferase